MSREENEFGPRSSWRRTRMTLSGRTRHSSTACRYVHRKQHNSNRVTSGAKQAVAEARRARTPRPRIVRPGRGHPYTTGEHRPPTGPSKTEAGPSLGPGSRIRGATPQDLLGPFLYLRTTWG